MLCHTSNPCVIPASELCRTSKASSREDTVIIASGPLDDRKAVRKKRFSIPGDIKKTFLQKNGSPGGHKKSARKMAACRGGPARKTCIYFYFLLFSTAPARKTCIPQNHGFPIRHVVCSQWFPMLFMSQFLIPDFS